MRRLLLLLPLLLLPAPAWAQKAVVLRSVGPSPYEEAADGFRSRFREAEVVLVAAGDRSEVASNVRARNPEVIFAIGPAATELTHKFLEDVPVVSAFTVIPEAPDEATVYIEPEIPAAVQLQRIRASLPDVKRLGVLFDPEKSSSRIDDLEHAAEAAKLEIVRLPVKQAREIAPAFRDAASRIDALLFIPDPTVSTKGNVRYLLRRCIAESIPAIGFTSWFADNGAVLSLSIDYRGLGVQAADQAESAGDGGRVVPPRAVISSYNLRVARKLGVRVDLDFDDPSVRVLE